MRCPFTIHHLLLSGAGETVAGATATSVGFKETLLDQVGQKPGEVVGVAVA